MIMMSCKYLRHTRTFFIFLFYYYIQLYLPEELVDALDHVHERPLDIWGPREAIGGATGRLEVC
jgi:hypothetical protein